jgi:hypothetical protein
LTILDVLYRLQRFIAHKIPVIEPDSVFKVFWDSTVVILIIINIFYIPMKLSFDFTQDSQPLATMVLQTIPSWFFMVDILLNFNTAYYHKGMIHTRRNEIIEHYLQSNFRWDLIIVVPFIISQFQVPYTDFTLLLRALRVKSMVENLEEILNLKDTVQAVFDLIKSVFFIIFVSHVTACAWHYLGEVQITVYKLDNSWLLFYKVYDDPW